jgi:hypothetical protein
MTVSPGDTTVQLSMGDRSWRARVISQGRVQSRHTGRALGTMAVTFNSTADEDEFVEELARRARRSGVLTGSDRSTRWLLDRSSYSYSTERSRRKHHWDLKEMEILLPEAVTIDGMEISPTRYHEEFRDEILHIDLRAAVDLDALARLQDIWLGGELVSVTRRGINSEPRLMELGWGPWSEFDGGGKLELSLTDHDPSSASPLAPLIPNIRAAVAYVRAHEDSLLDLLVEKGLIGEEESHRVVERAKSEQGRRSARLMLVADLDNWLWPHSEDEVLAP